MNYLATLLQGCKCMLATGVDSVLSAQLWPIILRGFLLHLCLSYVSIVMTKYHNQGNL